MTKDQVKEQVKKIFSMTYSEVKTYQTKISLSRADAKAKKLLFKACDARIAQCNISHALVEGGDISDIEGGY